MTDRELLARIIAGPRILLLGQGLKRFSLGVSPTSAGWFFPSEFSTDSATDQPALNGAALAAYETLVGDAPCPRDLKSVVSMAWNLVLTTRIDGAPSRWFAAPWRRVVPTASSSAQPSRSTTELQVQQLFGGLNLPDDERPPVGDLEWVDSQRHATDVLAAVAANQITPKGVVLVEGWSPHDWLGTLDLYNFASRLLPGQLHLFSADEDVLSEPLVRVAIEKGVIVPHADTLGTVLEDAINAGLLPEFSTTESESAHLMPAGSGFVPIDVSTWNSVIGTARPVDLELLEPFPYSSGPMLYQRFRGFLGSPDGVPPWRAVASGMKLPRSFEPRLLRQVESALSNPGEAGPILLQGQTASGKSLALVWLAQAIAKSGRAAVLHQSRRRDRPRASVVESFSLWAERVADLPTVLIWDGMVDADDYFTLQRHFRARGQKVLVVGSTYLSGTESDRVITAPIQLDDKEAPTVASWLGRFGIEVSAVPTGTDSSLLALLYRWVPETEAGLRRGLALESRAFEAGMEALSRERKQTAPESRMTAIAQAFMAAGVQIERLVPAEHAPEELQGLAFDQRSTTEQFSAMLQVAGRRGLSVPLELALRVVGRQGMSTIVDFFRNFDIYRWTDDAVGNQFLGVRTRLEAELLAREDLSDLAEIDVLKSFIWNVRPTWNGRTGGDEVQFIADLVKQMGPQGNESGRYGPWYGELAEAFAEHRTTSGTLHPLLVEMEVNLSREHVKRSQHFEELSRDERLHKFRASEQLLRRTIEEADMSTRSRLRLNVELAASIGSQIFELASQGDAPESESIEPLIERLMDAVMRAREADPENIYPVDVLAWSARDAVSSGGMSEPAKIDLLADAQASLDSIDPHDLSPENQAKHRSRQAEIAKLLGDTELSTKHLLELQELGSPAAYYLLASGAARASGEDANRVALATLLSAPASIREDWRCARLLLDLYWQSRVGDRLLRGTRGTIAFTEDEWRDCLNLLDTLHGLAQFDAYRASFVRGLALFHLGSIKASQEEFRRLGSLGLDISQRVQLSYLASNADGSPTEFTGRVAYATQDGRRGKVWVDQLRAEVDFVPMQFSSEAYRTKDEVVPGFHIGFNFRGPIADRVDRAPRPSGRAKPS